MDGVVACASLLLRKKQAYNSLKSRRKRRVSRRKIFAVMQSRERVMFALVLSVAALNFQLPVRSQWIKHRSSSWWEEIVNGTFTRFDWIEKNVT